MASRKRIVLAAWFAVSMVVCFAVVGWCVSGQTLTLSLDDSGQSWTSQAAIEDGVHSEFTIPAVSSKPVPKPSISAASFALMDAGTGQVLLEYRSHVRRPNASTTKIMTSILVMENCLVTDKITASKNCCQTMYTSIHLKPGEQISVKDLLAALLIRSANDASVAAAEHIAGSVPKFAEMMNKKAEQIGCVDTHFVTPNGLYDPNHYSSAYDLCLMARYAFDYPIFNEIIKVRKYTLTSRTMNRKDLVLFSRSKFLKNYPGADGVKSGYIKQAGQCYVGSATRDGWRLVSAVLKSKNVSQDTAALMNYGFNAYRRYVYAKAGQSIGFVRVGWGDRKEVAVAPRRDVAVVVPHSGGKFQVSYSIAQISAPVREGQYVGKIVSTLDGNTVDTVDLYAMEKVNVSTLRRSMPYIIGCCVLGCGILLKKHGRTNSKDFGCCWVRLSEILRNINRKRKDRC